MLSSMRRQLCAVLAGIGMLAATRHAAALPLIVDGKSDYQIVVPADAARPERFAAEELSRYLKEISGAALPIRAHSPPPLEP
jgi:hypothetical protein